jgi:hypothetical protein
VCLENIKDIQGDEFYWRESDRPPQVEPAVDPEGVITIENVEVEVPKVTVSDITIPKVTINDDDSGGSSVGIGILITFLVLCVIIAVGVGLYYYKKDRLCLKKCLAKLNCKRKSSADLFD